jgi:hypothetical protein
LQSLSFKEQLKIWTYVAAHSFGGPEYWIKPKFKNSLITAIIWIFIWIIPVVGVILSLSIWFIIKILYKETIWLNYNFVRFEAPIFQSIDVYALFICITALILQFYFKKTSLVILGVCSSLGILVKTLF